MKRVFIHMMAAVAVLSQSYAADAEKWVKFETISSITEMKEKIDEVVADILPLEIKDEFARDKIFALFDWDRTIPEKRALDKAEDAVVGGKQTKVNIKADGTAILDHECDGELREGETTRNTVKGILEMVNGVVITGRSPALNATMAEMAARGPYSEANWANLPSAKRDEVEKGILKNLSNSQLVELAEAKRQSMESTSGVSFSHQINLSGIATIGPDKRETFNTGIGTDRGVYTNGFAFVGYDKGKFIIWLAEKFAPKAKHIFLIDDDERVKKTLLTPQVLEYLEKHQITLHCLLYPRPVPTLSSL